MTAKLCSIKVLNQSFGIKCPDGEEDNLQRAVQKLNQQIAEQKNKFKALDDFKLLLLAALNVSHELINTQNEQEKQRIQVNQFINSLETKINKTVVGSERHSSNPLETID